MKKEFKLGVLVIGALLSGVSSAATQKVVITSALRFSPEHIQIRVGDTVEFVNSSQGTHTVTADPSLAKEEADVILPKGATPFNSGAIAPGKTFTHTFSVPGLYQYFCRPHELMGMLGQVEVLN